MVFLYARRALLKAPIHPAPGGVGHVLRFLPAAAAKNLSGVRMHDVSTFRGFHSAVASIASSLEALGRFCSDPDFDAALQPALDLLRIHLDQADQHAGPDA